MSAETVTFEHQRFGRIELPAAEVLHFDGLPGFPDARRFALLVHDRESAFLWFVSLDRPDLAFVVTHPHAFFPEYGVGLGPSQLASLGAKRLEDIEVLAIANVRDGRATLNLAAPLVIHPAAGRGCQVILDGEAWSTRQPLPELTRATAAPRGEAQIESKPQR